MSVYLDASALVALFVADVHNDQANKILRSSREDLIVSNLSVAEFSSVIARRVARRERHSPMLILGAPFTADTSRLTTWIFQVRSL